MTHAFAIGFVVVFLMVPVPVMARQTPADSGDTASGAQTPPPAPPSSFFRSITVSGLGDVYLVGNTNRPPDGDNLLRNFDTRSGELRLNYVEMAIERKATPEQLAGFRVDLGAGPTAKLVGAPEPGPEPLRYVQQAFVSVRAPVGTGLTIDVGKFVTPAGAEVIETQDNWNYSRSILFAWAIPYYHAGVRASYAITDKVSAAGFVLNGWNNVKDNNSSKTFAAQVAVAATPRISIAGAWIGGAEHSEVAGWRNLFDAVVNVALTERLKLQLNADFARDAALGPGVGWHGVSAAMRVEVTPSWSVAPRVEWFSDPQGASTGVAQDVTEATMTVQRVIAGGLAARAEYRVDHSTTPFFSAKGGGTTPWQHTVGVGLYYGWASK